MIPNYEYYDIIGIGDFSHRDKNIQPLNLYK